MERCSHTVAVVVVVVVVVLTQDS